MLTASLPAKNTPETERFYAWLDSMVPGPVDAREKKRMAAAIRFDLAETERRGGSREERLRVLAGLGYCYEGISL